MGFYETIECAFKFCQLVISMTGVISIKTSKDSEDGKKKFHICIPRSKGLIYQVGHFFQISSILKLLFQAEFLMPFNVRPIITKP